MYVDGARLVLLLLSIYIVDQTYAAESSGRGE